MLFVCLHLDPVCSSVLELVMDSVRFYGTESPKGTTNGCSGGFWGLGLAWVLSSVSSFQDRARGRQQAA